MFTVVQHGGMILPTGLGMGATHVKWAVMSLARAAGSLAMVTVADPLATMPGPAGTQLGSMQGFD